jgi:hypothetical protein
VFLEGTQPGIAVRHAAAALLLVAVLATVNYSVGIANPAHPVWDESYYLTAPLAALGLLVLQKLRPRASVDPQRRTLMTSLLVHPRPM